MKKFTNKQIHSEFYEIRRQLLRDDIYDLKTEDTLYYTALEETSELLNLSIPVIEQAIILHEMGVTD
jgi:hypothetical protein